MHPKYSLFLGAMLVAFGAAAPARAFTYSCGSMENWQGCSCSNDPLNYAHDQIDLFISGMSSVGHTNNHWYQDTNTWASDLVEDGLGGEDHIFTDPHRLYAYSGHGTAFTHDGIQRYRAGLCWAGTSASCRWQSDDAFFGERTGPYSTPNYGNLMYLLLATCRSVHTEPDEQWGSMLYYGGEQVWGYRYDSADSTFTKGVLRDFAQRAWNGNHGTFKSAWFWAAEDPFINDIASMVASGLTEADAVYRRDHMTAGWIGRWGQQHPWQAWSWHEG